MPNGKYLLNTGKLGEICIIDEILTSVENKFIDIQLTNLFSNPFVVKVNIDQFELKMIEVYFYSKDSLNVNLSQLQTDHLSIKGKIDKNKKTNNLINK